jgi:eukaryotic-like serine/threonine-protein kinase
MAGLITALHSGYSPCVMSLAAGTRLGPYEVVSLLGAGGMGEVYRARDPRLGRDVAIKALPENLARDPERLARFEREARLLASLNHPNIAAIYGLEEVGGQRHLVLEYVEGETLAHRLAKGALSLDETVHVCREIAAGVEAAHEGGVVHRDLKPRNVMLTPAGVVKVLDFGLAKGGAEAGEGGSAPILSATPTMTYAATQAGMVLGTAAYMSPEQARGKSVDRRTDIWSFGCILFECLSGKPAFDGETISDLLARILEREPDWSALPARTPARVRDLLGRCMVKDARQRLRDIGDARLELDRLLALGTSGVMAAADVPDAAATPRRGLPWWGIAAIVITAIVATALIQSMVSRRVDTMARHYEIGAPEPFGLVAQPDECVISPNGKMLAMVLTDSAGTAGLWVRPMDSFRARALPGTKGATQPFWSPDNRSLAFFAAGKLKKIALGGGDPEMLCDVRASRGGTWNRDGVIVFAPSSNGPLFRISANGGEVTAVTRLDSTRDETAHRFPRFLPDGRHYLFSVLGGNAGGVAVVAGTLGDTGRKTVLVADGGAAYSPSGHLLFTRNGVLSAQRFDPGSLRLSGEPNSLGDGLLPPRMTGTPVASVAEDGTLAYVFIPLWTARLAWFDVGGREVDQVPLAPGPYTEVELSPDGRSALLNHATSSTESELLVVDLERGTTNRVSNEPVVETTAWAPDGKRVAFTDGGRGGQKVIVVPADGSAPGETVMPAGGDFRRVDGWTPDGKALIIQRLDSQTRWDIWVLPLEGDRQPRPYLRRPTNEFNASVSPDGRWLCYNSDESGRVEGYVQAFPTPGRRYQVTTDGTGVGGWKADGKQLALGLAPNGVVRVVDVLPGEEFRIGPPRILGKVPDGAPADFDAAWTRWIAIVPAGRQPRPTIRIVLDWDAMIAKR